MPRVHHVLECAATNVHARISVDDVPVFQEAGGAVGSVVHVNPWLADEPTEIRIEAAGAIDEGALAGKLCVTLVARVEGEVERELFALELPRHAEDVVKSESRWMVQHVVRVPGLARPPSAFWAEARPLTLTDGDRVDIHELVLGCQRALDGMDTRALADALAFQTAEAARAYQIPEVHMRVVRAMVLEDAVGNEEIDPDSEEGLAELEETMQLHLVGRDRLVWVTREGYADALRVPALKPKVTLPIYLALRDRRWTIVR